MADWPVKVGTAAEVDALVATYRKTAAQLRASAKVLNDLHLAPSLKNISLQFGVFAEPHVDHIEDAAKFCDAIADDFTKLKASDPLIVGQDFGRGVARGYVHLLAIETRSLFGLLMAGTLAKVASVALMKDIKASDVRNWSE